MGITRQEIEDGKGKVEAHSKGAISGLSVFRDALIETFNPNVKLSVIEIVKLVDSAQDGIRAACDSVLKLSDIVATQVGYDDGGEFTPKAPERRQYRSAAGDQEGWDFETWLDEQLKRELAEEAERG